MADIATTVFGNQPTKNGYIVTSVLPTGKFEDRAPENPGESVSAAGYAAEFANRLQASGATYVVTR
jgi:hypothetical protein